jgi:tetratricopeptide (TPR) repeat protein
MYEKAEPIARRGLDLLSRALPEPHVHVVRVSERLANISLAKGNLKEAEELHKKALDGAEEIWGADHPGIVTNLVGLGSTYYSRLDFKRAEKYFKRSLTVMEKSSQIDTGQEYSLLRNLSCCYIAQLKLGDALSLVPATQRASYTAEVTSILDLVGTLVKFVGKQVDGYKKDRGEY